MSDDTSTKTIPKQRKTASAATICHDVLKRVRSLVRAIGARRRLLFRTYKKD